MTDTHDQELVDLMARLDPAQVKKLEAMLEDGRERLRTSLQQHGLPAPTIEDLLEAQSQLLKLTACCALLGLPAPKVEISNLN